MRTFVSQFIAILLLLVAPVIGHAGDLSEDQMEALREVSSLISVVHELSDQQLITKEQATEAENRYVEKGRKIVGRDISAAEIGELTKPKELPMVLQVILTIIFVAFLWATPWLMD
jgi:hypothetical protein